jgi:hypothetical protein
MDVRTEGETGQVVLERNTSGTNDCEIQFAHVQGEGTSLRHFPVDKEKSGQSSTLGTRDLNLSPQAGVAEISCKQLVCRGPIPS